MLKNGMTAVAEITDYTTDGQGVCRIEGCAVFVPNAVIGETCEIRVTKAGKNIAAGKIEKILELSPDRIPRDCPYAKLCGGCAFRQISYEAETKWKEKRVRDALERIGGVEFCCQRSAVSGQQSAVSGTRRARESGIPSHDSSEAYAASRTSAVGRDAGDGSGAEFLPIVPSPQVNGCRNKAQYPVAAQKGKPMAGFYKERTHQVIPAERCLLLPEEFDAAKTAVLSWMETQKVSAYDEQTGKGLIRHIYIRKGFESGQALVGVVANGSTLPKSDALVAALRQAVPGLRSVVLCVNQRPGNAVLGDKYITLFGDGIIEDTLCGLSFRLSPRSFYQVNHDQAEQLYAAAVAAAGLTGTETVLDLYCGTGTITLCLAKHAGRAYGVEIVEQAIADAKKNAENNGIENAEFFCADAGQAAAKFAADGIRPEVIVIDPPRKGVSHDVIDAMVKMAPDRIVYVSCDPATLARDVKLLTARGYRVRTAQPFDMFPRTPHVETVVLMSRASK